MSSRRHFTPDAARRMNPFSTGYSLFVRVLKYALPLGALVLVGVVVTRLSTTPLEQIDAVPKADTSTPGQIEAIAAQYEGVDDQGHPFTLKAERASRDPGNDKSVLLEKPKADMTLEDKTWLAAEAAAGTYDTDASRLILKDGVSLYHDSGYAFRAKDFVIDLKKRTASTSNPVSAQGPVGTLEAQRLDILDQGNRAIFGGPVRVKIYLDHKAG